MKKVFFLFGLMAIFLFLGTVKATTYECDSCADCNDKILNSASPGDTVMLNTSILDFADSSACIDFSVGTITGVTVDCDWNEVNCDGSTCNNPVYFSGSDNVIQDCIITMDSSAGYAILVTGADNNTVRNLIIDTADNGVTVESTTDSSIYNVSFDNIGGAPVYIAGDVSGLLMDGFIISETTDNGFDINSGASGITISNSVISNSNQYGIKLNTNNNIVVEDTTIYDCGSYAIYSVSVSGLNLNNVTISDPVYYEDSSLVVNDSTSINNNNAFEVGDAASSLDINGLLCDNTQNCILLGITDASATVENLIIRDGSDWAIQCQSCDNSIFRNVTVENTIGFLFGTPDNVLVEDFNIEVAGAGYQHSLFGTNSGIPGLIFRNGIATYTNTDTSGGSFYIDGGGNACNMTVTNVSLTVADGVPMFYLYAITGEKPVFYNNIFNASSYIVNGDGSVAIWNTTETIATNTVGGSEIGGNFWAAPNGSGFSQICENLNEDAFCDNNYEVVTGNTDFLPLATVAAEEEQVPQFPSNPGSGGVAKQIFPETTPTVPTTGAATTASWGILQPLVDLIYGFIHWITGGLI